MEQQYENGAGWTAMAPNLDFAMQEYLLLHDQYEELCQRLHELSPTSSLSPATSSMSLAPSPSTRGFMGRDDPSSPPLPLRDHQQRTTSYTWMSSSPAHHHARVSQRSPLSRDGLLVPGDAAAGDRKLFDVNEGMKRALTELLNCDVVRHDRAKRTWVQTRLMETERELRRERRRRSSAAMY
ncbi:hypothetical protein F5B17DRAFT_434336 [Nemania serpens]|nr:hypothetical protein F5B17DRAFT_434336 [Nemania serpens]